MKQLSKKGSVQDISPVIMGIVVATVVLTVGFIVLAELQTTAGQCPSTHPNFNSTGNKCWNQYYNASLNATSASNTVGTVVTKLGTIPNWIGILIVVAMSAIVLGYFYLKGGQA